MLKDLVLRNRSIRRFHENEEVDRDVLRELVDMARLTPSGANLQPLKYILSASRERNDLIFPCLSWAGYLKDWPGPEEGERPAAYIVILHDKRLSKSAGCDDGIAAQTIMLGAVEKGLGGCMIGSVDRDRLREALEISDDFNILLVLALGRPKEKCVIDEVPASGDIRYYRDAEGTHYVPKRSLDEIIVG